VKRLFGIFALTPAEQRVIIFIVLLLVALAWFNYQRDLSYESVPPATATASPAPDTP
jgi:hypothetical protein